MSSISASTPRPAKYHLVSLIPQAPRAALVAAATCLAAWQQRARSRAALRDLEPHHLKDIGVSAREREEEVRKPFWKA